MVQEVEGVVSGLWRFCLTIGEVRVRWYCLVLPSSEGILHKAAFGKPHSKNKYSWNVSFLGLMSPSLVLVSSLGQDVVHLGF